MFRYGIQLRRYLSQIPVVHGRLEQLIDRTLIKVSGNDVSGFLQGLITNDIHHLDTGPNSIYSLFLNTKGRVLYDTIIYRTREENTYYVECDRRTVEDLLKHMKIYRVRRQINFETLEDKYSLHAVFNPQTLLESKKLDKSEEPCGEITENLKGSVQFYKDLQIFTDPRVSELGLRIIAKTSTDFNRQLREIIPYHIANDTKNYRWYRYNLGIGEGVEDLPPASGFPLECNADYLHGVSFHKGCYIGQELTARVHHTGVVRKRLMPITFSRPITKLPADGKVLYPDGTLGVLRGVEGNVGLGLFRIKEGMALDEIKIGDGLGVVKKPNWWPIEMPKEKVAKI